MGRTWQGGSKDYKPLHGEYEELTATFCIDESRVFVVMNGSAARMLKDLPCSRWVNAVGVAGFLPGRSERFRCETPRPAIWFTPTNSRVLPIDGSENCVRDRRATLDDVEQRLIALHNCEGEPILSQPKHGECRRWSCDSPLMSCTTDGGLPWKRKNFATAATCHDHKSEFDVARPAWEFFQSLPPRSIVR